VREYGERQILARVARFCHRISGQSWGEVKLMIWETPAFVEIKMDAEIGSYQDDFDRDDSNGT
jgi:hypothetical protein